MIQDSFTYQDWEYGFTNGAFYAIPPKEKKKPKDLIKFYSLESYNLDALESPYLYCLSKFQPNDNTDDGLQLLDYKKDEVEKVVNNVYDGMIHQYKGDTEIIKQDPIFVELLQLKECLTADESVFRRSAYGFFHDFVSCFFSFISFTDDSNLKNTAMWGHYTKNRGYCIRYNFQNDALLSFYYPINYVDNIKLIELNKDFFFTQINASHLIKQKAWDYENEWRILINSQRRFNLDRDIKDKRNNELFENRKYPISQEYITEIYLAPFFLPPQNEIGQSDKPIISYNLSYLKNTFINETYDLQKIIRFLRIIIEIKKQRPEFKIYQTFIAPKDDQLKLQYYEYLEIEEDNYLIFKFKRNGPFKYL